MTVYASTRQVVGNAPMLACEIHIQVGTAAAFRSAREPIPDDLVAAAIMNVRGAVFTRRGLSGQMCLVIQLT